MRDAAAHLRWTASLLIAAGCLAGCLDHRLAPDDEAAGGVDASGVFIALQTDFAHFEDWMPFETEVMAEHGSASGTITEYLNKMPEADSSEFPVGTIIVKTVETKDGPSKEIHAMVKRGGDFNKRGALGWEFFELQKNSKGTPVIAWRGTAPPNGERYKNLLNPDANTMEADCNGCHEGTNNDAVLSAVLDLAELP